MSKNKPNRSAIRKKRKIRRKCQKQRQRMARTGHAKNSVTEGSIFLMAGINKQQQSEVKELKVVETNFLTDQEATTSRNCKNRMSPKKRNNKKRSPWKNAGGKLKTFRKIIDDQARKLIKRSVYLVNDNQTPRKCSPPMKIAKHHVKTSKIKRKKITNATTTTLEEGEIVTDDEESTIICNSNNNEEDEDDCVVIEQNVEKITIEDDNDNDNIPSCSDVLGNYQSLILSFKERVSSTPHNKKYTNASSVENTETVGNSSSETLPFFVDVCGRRSGLESINSTDTFIDYSKFSTLEGKSFLKPRRVRLKENSCNEIIDLDDSQQKEKEQSLTLQGESCEDDDSVIFVSETNKNDFISLFDDTIPPHKILKVSDSPNTPVKRKDKKNNSLFTLSETKKLNEYNENAYNPGGDKTLTNIKRMVIIDGSNVAFKHGLDQVFSVKGLKIAIEYFEKMGHEVKAVIPQFRMNKSKSSDPEELERLHKAGKIVQTPCKNLPGLTSTSYDDRFILQLAFELDAAIVSNDNYRDLLHENPAFKKIIENRVIGYTWCNDIFILPKDPYGKWGPTLHKILNR